MSLFSMLTPYKMYVIAGALVALVVGEFFFVRDIYVTKWKLEITTIRAENEQAAKEHLEKIRITEADLAAAKLQLENDNVVNKKKIADVNAVHAKYVAEHGLRDPGRKAPAGNVSCNPGSVVSNPGPVENARLSEEASGFLLALTREADEMKADFQTCYAWKNKVMQILKKAP